VIGWTGSVELLGGVSTTDPETASQNRAPSDDELASSGSGRLVARADQTAYECARCVETRRTCPSCVQCRRYLWLLVNQHGETIERAARIMGLSLDRAHALVEEANHRRERGSLKCDSIPVALTRAVVEQALARDPNLTIADMARWLDMTQADFERAFIGKNGTGRTKSRVNVSNASRLMIALGRAPNELPGC